MQNPTKGKLAAPYAVTRDADEAIVRVAIVREQLFGATVATRMAEQAAQLDEELEGATYVH